MLSFFPNKEAAEIPAFPQIWSARSVAFIFMQSSAGGDLVDVRRVREETRGCSNRMHLNNAGAALMPALVVDAYVGYIREEELEGGYEVEAKRIADLNVFYSASAAMLNCKEEEVAFVESASRGWALAFFSLTFKPGDRIITSAADYGSNFVSYLQARDKYGAEVVIVGDDAAGDLDLDVLRQEAAHARARVICMSHIPTGGGRVIPAKEVGAIAKAHGLPYFLDACQSVGMLRVDVHELQCQVLTATGRKFLRGPRGTGLLYVSTQFVSSLDPCMLDQQGAVLESHMSFAPVHGARRFEMWESNCAGKAALGVAIAYALAQGLNSGVVEERVTRLASILRQGLHGLDHVTCTDIGSRLCAIVTFVVCVCVCVCARACRLIERHTAEDMLSYITY